MTDSLLSRLQSEGPSRELDAEIALANGWRLNDNIEDLWLSPDSHLQSGPPRYTESIDAKMPGEDIVTVAEQKGDPVKWMALQRPVKGQPAIAAYAHTEAMARRLALLIAIHKAQEESKP